MKATANHHAGLAAEEIAARHYEARGARVLARRWRGRGGEIDVIAEAGDETVFVEVKRAATHDAAAWRLGPRQRARLRDCAGEFLATRPAGLLTPARFDVALVDAAGRVRVIENALQEG